MGTAKKNSASRLFVAAFLGLAIIIALAFFYLLFLLYYQNRFYPGVRIASIDVSGQKPVVVKTYLQNKFQEEVETPLALNYKGDNFTVNLTSAQPQLNLDDATVQGYNLGRSGNMLVNLITQARTFVRGNNITPQLSFNQPNRLISQLTQINETVTKPATNARINISGSISVIPSESGLQLDDQLLLNQIKSYLLFSEFPPQNLPVKVIPANFPTQTAQKYQQLLEQDQTTPIQLQSEAGNITLDAPALLSILNLSENKPFLASAQIDGQNVILEKFSLGKDTLSDSQPIIDKDKLSQLLSDLSQEINQPAQDAKFVVDNSSGQLKVSEFQPAKEGKEINIDQTAQLITKALTDQGSSTITLPIAITKPKVTTDSVNNIGIKELIGEGVSHFDHSIPDRIYNIGLAASRINGTLVAPGDTFSFNKAVGEITGATGYKPAYVIKSGRTVLDDGGGVCQVSTTVFRSALNTGLPIVARTAHAYRVGYYEQDAGPGLDATVFAPSVDLKFKNDTGHYILLQTHIEGTALYVDIYGTSDGRKAVISKPLILSQTPPLPDIRQDDPTLPKGEVKQVDWSAWGATTIFSQTVTRNGVQLINETFKSVYRPWSNVFLVGTKEG